MQRRRGADGAAVDGGNSDVAPVFIVEERKRLLSEQDKGPPPPVSTLEHFVFKLYNYIMFGCMGLMAVFYLYKVCRPLLALSCLSSIRELLLQGKRTLGF